MTINLAGLNPNQRASVGWGKGPLLVVAGPGSGKTRVLTLRIARLIEQSPNARFRVLGITFTNKAASEMRVRIDGMLTEGRDRAVLTTFHSFAADILRQHGSHVGLRPDFAILSEQADREAVLADAIKSVIPPDSDFTPRAAQILPAISRLLDECVLPTEAADHLDSQLHAKELASIYSAYRARLAATNQLDFGALLATAVELLERYPVVAKQIRRVYSYVCVDEYQDTNSAQNRLLVQLVPAASPNLFVVADDDQIIYQWNGASPDRLHELRGRFNMDVLQLPENYRCPPDVIEVANRLIKNNTDRSTDKKPLYARKTVGGSPTVTVIHATDLGEEVNAVAQRIAGLPAAEREKCVILARRKKLLEEAVSALQAASLPAYIAVRKNEFQSAPYRWLHSLLRLANARQDREHLRRLCRAFYELEGLNLAGEAIVAKAAVDGTDYLTAWLDMAERHAGLSDRAAELTSSVRALLLDRMDYWGGIKAAEDWFEYHRAHTIGTSGTAFDEYEDEGAIWSALVEDIGTHYSLNELSLHSFLQEMDLRAKQKPAPAGAVRCFTIHASKGMEFRHVFLIGLVEEELPSWAAIKNGPDSPEIREERRNCFVAITRAEETLTLSYADRYLGHCKAPSRFLAEMGAQLPSLR